jgi:putative ABC transport system permease protein
LVIGDGLRLILVGLAIGGIVGAGVARAISRLLFRVGSLDPIAFAGAGSLLIVVALIASAVPARRAARIDTITALRSE